MVFGLTEGQVSQPVQSPFGWHLFKVTKITPEAVVPLAVVHDDLAKDLALAGARDRLPNLATKLDDELAAGSSLADAAKAVGLEARSLPPVDAKGNDEGGHRPDGLPAWPEFLKVAFETPAGEPSLLEETEAGGYFVLRVDEVRRPGSGRSTRSGRSWSRRGRPSSATIWRKSAPRICSSACRTGRRSRPWRRPTSST